MNDNTIRIFPLGDSALTVEFGQWISPDLNRVAIALSTYLDKNPFPGYVESVPAYASTTIFYDLITVRRQFSDSETAFASVRRHLLNVLPSVSDHLDDSGRNCDIPVHFDKDSALDLDYLAEASGLSAKEVIEIFTASTYRVFMLGFLPGFTYMGEVDPRIATPRRTSPRLEVPKGSVGIAGNQTGIYSLKSPGGWQIIGRTDIEMFRPTSHEPTFLQPGDMVRFVPAK